MLTVALPLFFHLDKAGILHDPHANCPRICAVHQVFESSFQCGLVWPVLAYAAMRQSTCAVITDTDSNLKDSIHRLSTVNITFAVIRHGVSCSINILALSTKKSNMPRSTGRNITCEVMRDNGEGAFHRASRHQAI